MLNEVLNVLCQWTLWPQSCDLIESAYEHSAYILVVEAVVRRCSVKNLFLEISQNSQEHTCARVSFLIKLQGWRPATLLKKRRWHSCFPVNFVKFLRQPFFTEHLCWLLLWMVVRSLDNRPSSFWRLLVLRTVSPNAV